MCSYTCLNFGKENIFPSEIKGKNIIEVGSLNVNGTLRNIIEEYNPNFYLGVDIENGNNVDEICNAENLIEKFGKESFDVVICTEMMEHVFYWQKVIRNLKGILKKNGLIILTTRSIGFPYHSYPNDFWRFEVVDIANIFSDFKIIKIETDSFEPGVFIKAYKTDDFKENDLKNYFLHKMF